MTAKKICPVLKLSLLRQAEGNNVPKVILNSPQKVCSCWICVIDSFKIILALKIISSSTTPQSVKLNFFKHSLNTLCLSRKLWIDYRLHYKIQEIWPGLFERWVILSMGYINPVDTHAICQLSCVAIYPMDISSFIHLSNNWDLTYCMYLSWYSILSGCIIFSSFFQFPWIGHL